VGAGLARSGLGKRTALGTATLLIGANLPDVDVLAYVDGPGADLAFRRGWTHGLPALVVLPFILTGAMLLFDRAVRRAGHAVLPSAVKPRQILLLAAVSVLTHPILDTLNTYGVRWLMPVRGDWFYGDTLFIADPWLWLTLGLGVMLSRARRGSQGYMVVMTRPARVALAVGGAYVVGMLVSGLAARGIARQELETLVRAPVERLMVAPRPVTPFSRSVVALQGGAYRVGTFRWFRRPHVETASLRSFPAARPACADPGRHGDGARPPVPRMGSLPDGAGRAQSLRRGTRAPDRPALRRPAGRGLRQRHDRGGRPQPAARSRAPGSGQFEVMV
jgi:Predicted membrane-bound metal-dependent hydrolases